MQEEIQLIIDLILQWGPSLVSIITMICTVIVAIKKIASSNDDNLKEISNIESKIADVLKENAELKKSIKKMTNKVYKIKDTEE